MIKIPWQSLKENVLSGVIKDFVLREGTDYGAHEFSLDEKVAQVKKQLELGAAQIVFDETLGTCNILVEGGAEEV